MVIFTLLFLAPALLLLSIVPILLSWLGVAITVAAAILLVGNGIFLAVLIFFHRWMTGKGYFDPVYWDSLGDWRGKALHWGKLLLTAGIIWEGLVTAACAAVLLLRPTAWFL